MNKRVDIKTGFVCNNNCKFCVQADNKCQGNRTFEEIERDLTDSRSRCDGVVLTGGEVTIRKDFFDVVRLAKRLGYETIQIQSNGRMFSSLDFCRKTIEAGATEFALALHGYCAEQHDSLVRAPGSFNQVVQGIRNLSSLGANVLSNTVVVKQNYKDLSKIARLLVDSGVGQYQLAFVHGMGNAWNNFDEVVPDMSEAAPFIHEGLQVGIDAGINVMSEAMPYCLMKGYEDYIAEKIMPFTEIKGRDFQNTLDFDKQRKEKGKEKFLQCKECRHNDVCEGVWNDYFRKRGSEEFSPVR